MIVRKTLPQESLRVDQLFAIAFEQPMENGPAGKEDPRVHHWAAYLDDDRTMMSTFTITDYPIRFDGHSCKMGGVGGVATLPQYRRQGGIRGCFEKALPDMYRTGYDFSYLYPFSTAYYRRFGYECGVKRYAVKALLSFLKPRPVSGALELLEDGSCQREIQELWETWESRYNLTVVHREEDFRWVQKLDPAARQEFTYLYRNAEGKAAAMTTFRLANEPDGRNLVCSRFCFLDREGFDGLMHLFQSLAADHRYVKFQIPTQEALLYLSPEWSFGAVEYQLLPAGMVRVVNAQSVLEKAAYRGSGSLRLGLTDGQIPENSGTFAVEFREGKAVRVERTGEPAEAAMDIQTFSAAISGVFDAGELAWLPGVAALCETERLAQVFYKKPMAIHDYF